MDKTGQTSGGARNRTGEALREHGEAEAQRIVRRAVRILGLGGLVVGREYRVLRSADLSAWEEAARFTVTEDPWPASGRVDREWTEAAVLPGRRFYRIAWEEPP